MTKGLEKFSSSGEKFHRIPSSHKSHLFPSLRLSHDDPEGGRRVYGDLLWRTFEDGVRRRRVRPRILEKEKSGGT